jgi:hypothetical protein
VVPISSGDVERVPRVKDYFVAFESFKVWKCFAEFIQPAEVHSRMYRAGNLIEVFVLPLIKKPDAFLAFEVT